MPVHMEYKSDGKPLQSCGLPSTVYLVICIYLLSAQTTLNVACKSSTVLVCFVYVVRIYDMF